MPESPEQRRNEAILLRDDVDGVATLTLNRPEQYNVLSQDMLETLLRAWETIAADESVRVVVLAAKGRAYSSGHDLKELRGTPDRAYHEKLFRTCSRMMLAMTRIPQPIIAKVQGLATAAGCQLVASADLAVASTEARFATSGVNLGLFCSTPGVAVSRNLSRKQAFEMLVTGDFIDAHEAARIGLINRAVPPEELDDAVQAMAAKIAAKLPAAVRSGKQMFYKQLEMGAEDAYRLATDVIVGNLENLDTAEGIDAFIEKRPPDWQRD